MEKKKILTKISREKMLNTSVIASNIFDWFKKHNFEMKIVEIEKNFYIMARKGKKIVLKKHNQSIIVGIESDSTGTCIEIKNGEWIQEKLSKSLWKTLKRASSIFIAGWTQILQKDLENRIENEILTIPEVMDLDYKLPKLIPSQFSPIITTKTSSKDVIKTSISAISKIKKDIKKGVNRIQDKFKSEE